MHPSSDKLLKEWASSWKQENLSPDIRKLISQANFDLYYGPCKNGSYGDPTEGDEEWDSYPGFSQACDLITNSLKEMPSDLYLDSDTGETRDSEPEPERCESCEGEGHYYDEGERFKCDACNGRGSFEPAGNWWHFERGELRVALVGQELSHYVKS